MSVRKNNEYRCFTGFLSCLLFKVYRKKLNQSSQDLSILKSANDNAFYLERLMRLVL